MNTKKTKKPLCILGWLGLAIFISLFAACSFTGESIQDRIGTFIDAINAGDVQGIKDCLDPSATDYNNASTADFWNTYFPNSPYSISGYSESGNIATVNFMGNNDAITYIFEMTEQKGSGLFSPKTYLIRRVKYPNNTTIFE